MNCAKCHKVILGQYVIVGEKQLHINCFVCSICKQPIKSQYVYENDNYFHSHCFNKINNNNCFICGGKINGQYVYDEWGNKAHLKHQNIKTRFCQTCGKILKSSDSAHCVFCNKSLVTLNTNTRSITHEILDNLDKIGLNVNEKNIYISIVNESKLKDLNSKSYTKNQKGLTITKWKQSIISKSLDHYIYIIGNIHKIEFSGILAHELTHVWLNEHNIKLQPEFIEGICNLSSAHIYENNIERINEILLNNLYADSSPIYGTGFRKMKAMLEKIGWDKLLFDLKNKTFSYQDFNQVFNSVKNIKISVMKIFVTSPCFDDIGKILNQLELKYSSFNNSYDCDILFLNCGTSDSIDSTKLNKFVKKGGVLYASDLTSSLIDQTFPDIFNFKGDIGDTGTIEAEILDGELKAIIGHKIDVYFDMGTWSVLESINKGDVILKSTITGEPLMVQVNYGKGKIFYTCFHNHAQASEKEAIILRLFVLKQISQMKNTTIQEVGKELNIELSEYAKHFESDFLDDYKIVSKNEKITNNSDQGNEEQQYESNWDKLSKSENNLANSDEDDKTKIENDNIWNKL